MIVFLIIYLVLNLLQISISQLTIDELFSSNFKFEEYPLNLADCSSDKVGLIKNFTNKNYLKINATIYNQLYIDCDNDQLLNINLRNPNVIWNENCENKHHNDFTFRYRFLLQDKKIQVQIKEFNMEGVELCSIDEYMKNVYEEYQYYRSNWAVLISIMPYFRLAFISNNEMSFLLVFNEQHAKNEMDILFPMEQLFKLNNKTEQKINVYRIDQGYVRIPKQDEINVQYELSKHNFIVNINETFLFYGTQNAVLKEGSFRLTINDQLVSCRYNYLLFCTFPILVNDTVNDTVNVLLLHDSSYVYNQTVGLISRKVLNNYTQSIYNLTDIQRYQFIINNKYCR
ncbi:unnamed protein product [Didymodactylos carnosus]|uniref:Transmembrane protein n=1 Tax=Didymodactylos carnosus TaxID=1234261 RepID=A0A813VBM4_9BILA|nr:unnamed protein product [Didymodactylos carnosus]CAF1038060.1 unnamed protein product [Didymodactylos carnosus]CAF3628380.1 unnamed protein product [Didymodactylos carnosus]CAF3806193.1 unnamed protein product [Didymodactylos carnosus]